MLAAVAGYTARQFARAIVMPNLSPPITTAAAAEAYRDRILAALPAGHGFTPLMTCYLTDDADPQEVVRGFEAGVFAACKLYPRSEEHTSELQSLMRISYAVFCLKKQTINTHSIDNNNH